MAAMQMEQDLSAPAPAYTSGLISLAMVQKIARRLKAGDQAVMDCQGSLLPGSVTKLLQDNSGPGLLTLRRGVLDCSGSGHGPISISSRVRLVNMRVLIGHPFTGLKLEAGAHAEAVGCLFEWAPGAAPYMDGQPLSHAVLVEAGAHFYAEASVWRMPRAVAVRGGQAHLHMCHITATGSMRSQGYCLLVGERCMGCHPGWTYSS